MLYKKFIFLVIIGSWLTLGAAGAESVFDTAGRQTLEKSVVLIRSVTQEDLHLSTPLRHEQAASRTVAQAN